MTIVSMTGFAEMRGSSQGLRWRWETKSVNGRGLDIRMRVPPGFEALEAGARILVVERFKRGSLQSSLAVAPDEAARTLRIDPVALADAVRIARQVADETGLSPARIDGLMALKGVMIQEETQLLDDAARLARDAAMLESFAAALDLLAKARATEGSKLQKVLLGQLAEIEKLTGEARGLAANQPALVRERLMAQLKDVISGGGLSEERIAQEVALLATRADTREELDRLTAHVQEARALIGAAEPAGRKLDFLAQEFNREANTLCSKSSDIALTRVGLALKAVIDQFREQVQNVE